MQQQIFMRFHIGQIIVILKHRGQVGSRAVFQRLFRLAQHAPHHISFLHQGTLFVGEAAGTFLDLGDAGWYLRPATPPRFMLEIAVESIDRLLALEPAPERLAFAHHGLLTGHARELLQNARDQHEHWVDTVRKVRRDAPDADFDALCARVVDHLSATDPHFARRRALPEDIGRREQDFTRQTMQGMVQYVESAAAHPRP